jgi:hypothetical protein
LNVGIIILIIIFLLVSSLKVILRKEVFIDTLSLKLGRRDSLGAQEKSNNES